MNPENKFGEIKCNIIFQFPMGKLTEIKYQPFNQNIDGEGALPNQHWLIRWKNLALSC